MKKTSALIVEDEMITAIFLRHLLEEEGCDVIDVIATGEEVLARIGTRKPDVIVMDIMLAGEMDGIETAIQVRQRHDIPILFRERKHGPGLHQQGPCDQADGIPAQAGGGMEAEEQHPDLHP